jgi:hypothetical protein
MPAFALIANTSATMPGGPLNHAVSIDMQAMTGTPKPG